jgi:pimeloyl-ACP methyl ester carboxylesterase
MQIEPQYINVGPYEWFYRSCAPIRPSNKPPVVFLHGLIAPSYSWRNVLPDIAALGYHGIAPDWLGSGRSAIPDQRDFDYKPQRLVAALGDWLDAMAIERCALVVQGYSGIYGIQYAVQNPDRVERLAIVNTPIAAVHKLPWKIKQLGLPLIGEALVQDFSLPDKLLEGGGGYRVEEKDMNIYRQPWLTSSDYGRALHALIRQLDVPTLAAVIEQDLKTWQQPLLVAWGDRDPWLPIATAQAAAQTFPAAEFVALEAVGHYPQEDWHEKVTAALGRWLRRSI